MVKWNKISFPVRRNVFLPTVGKNKSKQPYWFSLGMDSNSKVGWRIVCNYGIISTFLHLSSTITASYITAAIRKKMIENHTTAATLYYVQIKSNHIEEVNELCVHQISLRTTFNTFINLFHSAIPEWKCLGRSTRMIVLNLIHIP